MNKTTQITLIPVFITAGLGLATMAPAEARFHGVACNFAPGSPAGVSYGGLGYDACNGAVNLGNSNDSIDYLNQNIAGYTVNSGPIVGIDPPRLGTPGDWLLSEKIDVGGSDSSNDPLGFSFSGSGDDGTWTIGKTGYKGPVVLEVNTASISSFYYFANVIGGLSGTWDTVGVSQTGNDNDPNGTGKDLSHLALFYSKESFDEQAPPEDVPEPSTMLGTALLCGFVFNNHRRNRKKTLLSKEASAVNV